MAYDTLLWLQDWYLAQCDGDWEHQNGVEIGNVDNPGWSLEISVSGTSLEGLAFDPVRIERSEHDWVSCRLESERFKAACGPLNLVEAVEIFRVWVAGHAVTQFERRKIARLGG